MLRLWLKEIGVARSLKIRFLCGESTTENGTPISMKRDKIGNMGFDCKGSFGDEYLNDQVFF